MSQFVKARRRENIRSMVKLLRVPAPETYNSASPGELRCASSPKRRRVQSEIQDLDLPEFVMNIWRLDIAMDYLTAVSMRETFTDLVMIGACLQRLCLLDAIFFLRSSLEEFHSHVCQPLSSPRS